MEEEDKILAELIRQDYKAIKTPSNLSHKVMMRIEESAASKRQPLVSYWVWLLIVCFLIGVGALNYKYNLQFSVDFIAQSWLDKIDELIESSTLPLIALGVIIVFTCFDFIGRKLRITRR
jgi:SNF family Na+-dependent transporter